MKKLGLVITDGVGYRNFVLSDFLREASKAFDKLIIYSGLPKSSYDISELSKNIEIKELQVFIESNKTWFYRKLKEVAHMYQHRNYYGINNNLTRGYPKRNTKRALITKFIYKVASLFNSEKHINYFEKLQFKSFKKDIITRNYFNLLNDDKPDILFFTHQRPPYLAPFLSVAKQLNIHSNAFIFSWDNLASKGRMMGSFDSYFVWSDLMQKELKNFYPNTLDENIKIIGTPQFEPYVLERYKTNKEEYCKKFGLNKSKKTICYSCADAGIGANDSIHITSVMKFIEKNENLDLQLLVRTSPAEDGLRFESLKKKFPQIKWNIPKWILTRNDHIETWTQRIPSIEDMVDLKSILKFADVNVNMCSTMSLDFMLFDKPVINTVFGNKNNGLYNDQLFLNYVHYKYVIDSKAVTIAKNEEELHAQLNEALIKPELRKAYRKELLKLEISKPLEGTSKRIAETLLELSS